MQKVLRKLKLLGTPFDPNIHDAISFKFDDSVPENTRSGN